MKTITLEEHFLTRDYVKATGGLPPNLQGRSEPLLDIGEGRIRAMDEGGVDLQVLSLAAIGMKELPAAEEAAVLRGVNDELAAAVSAHPRRFQGFAALGMKRPAEAARELERCVKELGFPAVMLDGTVDGKFLDAPEFLPVLEAMEALDVPLYLHPARPPESVFDAYYAGLPHGTGELLSIAGWGWHSETAIHVLRLIVSGTLDRVPKLKLIVGHMGEGLPFALARTNAVFSRVSQLKRSVAETMREQVWITTSGVFTQPPFQCAVDVLGLDRMMYSVDYPFSANTTGEQFLQSLDLTEPERERFAGGLAMELLGLERQGLGVRD
jgi:predicted TIM-barrel fold metal-dependent hydrolase